MGPQTKDRNGSHDCENQNSNEELTFPYYQKSRESEELIKSAIMNNEFLREGLGDKEVMQAVVDAMYTKNMPGDNYVIKEGEIGKEW